MRWELALLSELGFGLDLEACAATGETEDLVFVSPKSGRAVSASAGAPYAERLLRLPGFLRSGSRGAITDDDIIDGLHLTGRFLVDRVLQPRDVVMPSSRDQLAELLRRSARS